jgi:hypothetical protein
MNDLKWFGDGVDFETADWDDDDTRELAAATVDPWFGAMGWTSFRSDARGIDWDPPCDKPTGREHGLRAFWDRRTPERVTVCAHGETLDCTSPFHLALVLAALAQRTGVGRVDEDQLAACCARYLLLGSASIELARHAAGEVFAEERSDEDQRALYRRLGLLGDFRRSAYARQGAGRRVASGRGKKSVSASTL